MSEALRAHLEQNNGIPGLETVTPDRIEEAVRLFRRDGFVVVTDVLSGAELQRLRDGCAREIDAILALDPEREGNRGSHRYSFGSSSLSGHLVHLPEWAMLIDLPTVTPIVSAIFGAPDYHLRGGGGDFCLPGAVEYQRLHADMGDRRTYSSLTGKQRTGGSFHDPSGRFSVRDLPIPSMTVNFLTVDFTRLNGPTRQIPATQHSREPIPSLDDEPEWMRLSTVCPAPAGSALIRDIRAWHGGTPNLSDEVRAIPNVEFWAPWYRENPRMSMPQDVWRGLSDHARRVARPVVAIDDDGLELGYRTDLGR
ncbi:MAG: phytanoyl-CoA dioxygenase family protein [Actinomycetota bacterium]